MNCSDLARGDVGDERRHRDREEDRRQDGDCGDSLYRGGRVGRRDGGGARCDGGDLTLRARASWRPLRCWSSDDAQVTESVRSCVLPSE